MSDHFAQPSTGNSRLYGLLDRALLWMGTYAFPIVVGLLSFVALTSWEAQFVVKHAQLRPFQVIEETDQVLFPDQASRRLQTRLPQSRFDTGRSESPFWLRFSFAEMTGDHLASIEFPSRHATSVTCWDEKTLNELGTGTFEGASGSVQRVKAGFALGPYAVVPVPESVLCRMSFVGPASVSVLQWPVSELVLSTQDFHRKSGLLDGGLIVLALFMLVTALIVRQSAYVFFAAWLIANLRLAALSAGWDAQWLGQTVPAELILQTRLLTVAIYFVLTVTLFRTMFRDDLEKIGYPHLLRGLQWICIPLLVLSVALSYRDFLPFLWIATVLGVLILCFYLVRILSQHRSNVAIWFAASFAVTLLAGLSEVLSAALGFKGVIGAVNSVTAALSSSLLAALAVAEQMRVEHEERMNVQAELQHTFDAMPIGLFTLDIQGRFLSVNPAMRSIMGIGSLDVEQEAAQWDRYFSPGTWSRLLDMAQNCTHAELEIGSHPSVGQAYAKRFLVKAIMARGKIEGSLQDVTEKAAALQELRFLADNDPLTKVFNRRGIERMLDQAMTQLADGKPLAMAYLDLDRFKLINTLYGHGVGDQVLRSACSRVTSMLTGTHQMGRVGGDEFIIVFPDTHIALASWICRGIIAAIGNESYSIGDKAFQVRCSIGLIEIANGTRIKDAVAMADSACRAAKKGTSDNLVVYERNAAAFHERETEFSLVERLSSDIATSGLFLDMQPIMSLKEPHASLNFEVLLRMLDANGGVISAGQLIAAAEGCGRTGIIDRWVMMTTLHWIAAHFDKLQHTQFVCMNLSGASLNDERFMQDAFAMLIGNPIAAGRLCIEITESVALHDLGNTRRFIDQVREYGVKVALDDFGAGYTSFSYLKNLPADVLKIDGSFIVNMVAHPANIAIVEAIVSLAQSLGMKTIAEWAEDNATVQTLAEIGIDYVQGYAIAKPQPPANILAARSAASFIKDDALAVFVKGLQYPAPAGPYLKLHKDSPL